MGAYEIWRDTRDLKANRPEDAEYLAQVEEQLRPAALKDYITRHSLRFDPERHDWDEITGTDVAEFLAGLDEIRGGMPGGERIALVAEMHQKMLNALTALSRANWTGEHTYGDALDDARQVLTAVLNGKPFPKLERFRCPSEYGSKARQNERVHCELQLPHEGKHRAQNTAGGEGYMWTDEQSVNPPKPYDEPVSLGPLKVDLDAEELSGHPVRSDDGQCGAAYTGGPPADVQRVCVRAKRHAGLHRDETGARWPQEGSGA